MSGASGVSDIVFFQWRRHRVPRGPLDPAARGSRDGASRAPRGGEAGIGLVEVLVAVLLLGLASSFAAQSLMTSASADAGDQGRLAAAQLAASALAEVEALPYSEVAQGLSQSTSSTGTATLDGSSTAAAGDLPLEQGPGGCWYYGTGTSWVVPADAANTTLPPLVPYASTVSEDGTTYMVATIPMVPVDGSATSTCTAEQHDSTDAEAPVTVLVDVSWVLGGHRQALTQQTVLYATGSTAGATVCGASSTTTSSTACPTSGTTGPGGPGAGAPASCSDVQEALLANPSPGPLTPGATASIFFLDEAPTTIPPEFLVNGTEDPSITATTTVYGTTSQPFLPADEIYSIDQCGGSPPNADDPPTTAQYPPPSSSTSTSPGAGPSNFPAEDQLTFTVPSDTALAAYPPITSPSDPDVSYWTLTIIVFDHDGNDDSYTWVIDG